MLVAEVAPRSSTCRPSRPVILRTNSFSPLERRSMRAPDGCTDSVGFGEPPPNIFWKKDTGPVYRARDENYRFETTACEWRLSNRNCGRGAVNYFLASMSDPCRAGAELMPTAAADASGGTVTGRDSTF